MLYCITSKGAHVEGTLDVIASLYRLLVKACSRLEEL